MYHFNLDQSGNNLHITGFNGPIDVNDAEKLLPVYCLEDRLALIDRDGVVVNKAPRHKYHLSIDSLRLIPGAAEAINYLNEKQIPVIFVTNQPGIYKGLFKEKDLIQMNIYIEDMIRCEFPRSHIDGVFYCPHPAPTEGDADAKPCTCRKPNTAMLDVSMKIYHSKKKDTFMFGDFASDIEAGIAAGVNPIYVATRHDEFEAMQEKISSKYPDVYSNHNYPTLLDAVRSELR